MTDDPPRPTSEGELIRRVRNLSIPKLTISAAAARVGLSAEQWGYVERGYYPARDGHPPRPFSPPAATLAKMAHTLRITPERLEYEGRRPDAAEMLREIIRQQSPGPGLEDFPDVSPELRRAIEAHLRRILDRLEVARGMNPSGRISGAMIFPSNVRDPAAGERNRRDAERWDLMAETFPSWKPEAIAMGTAVHKANEEALQAERDKAEQDGYATG